ncbi:DUF2752 domain-containing protein [Nostoc sp. HG1]|nr:DUF2752 domain-containing protein [Nostoc sp. HG1]
MLLLSPLVKHRRSCLAICGSVGLHLTLVTFNLPSWQCPIRSSLGIPCPGCGLSRAMVAIAHGDWQRAMTIHAFAPIAIIVLSIVLVATFLPKSARIQLGNRLEKIERQSGITALLLSISLIYWLVRLLLFTNDLYRLVM